MSLFPLLYVTVGRCSTKSLVFRNILTCSREAVTTSSVSCVLCSALSLSHDAAVVLVHAFVTSRVDQCSSILAGFPSGLISRLDRVLRSAARPIGRIPNYASVSAYMRDVLHWLPASPRISYRIAALVHRRSYMKAGGGN